MKTHEDGHRTVLVEFLKESKIKSYYTGETLDFESSCVEESQLTTEKEALINECKNAMNAIRDEIYTDYEKADNEYHKDAPYSVIDTSKDCT